MPPPAVPSKNDVMRVRPLHPRTTPPGPGGGGGFFRFLLLVALLAVGGFDYAAFRFHESPQKVWKRLVEAAESLLKPKAAPTPTHTPSPTPILTPKPTAKPTPVPTATPLATPTPVDPIAWLLEHKEHQPKELTLLRQAILSITENGKVAGSVTVPAGAKVQVVNFAPHIILVHWMNASGQLPHDATNLRSLAQAEMDKPEPTPVPSIVEAAAPASTSPAAPTQSLSADEKPFLHPGVVLTEPQLAAIRHAVKAGREPWVSWFKQYDGDPGTVGNEGQYEEYGRNGDVHRGEFQSDMWQLYRMAMLWTVNKDRRAAERGVGILENYAKNHKRFSGVEATFMQGDCMNGVVAAEILRSTYPGWTEKNTENIKRYFRNVWWDTIRIGQDNCGAGSHLWTANQGTIGLKVAMATAIFCDDRVRFNMCVNSYLTDPLTGLENSLPNGQIGDTGRDTGHWTAEAIDDGWICQMAWAQGIDLFAQRNNRIVAISEYLAQNQLFALGKCEQPPFIPYGSSYEFDTQAAHFEDVRGREFLAVVEEYAQRKKIPAPFTHQLLRHEDFKPIYTLDEAIKAAPVGPTWTQPQVSPVSSLRSKDIGDAHGSTSHSGEVWSLDSDSKRMEDACRLAYIEAEGDWTFVARVTQDGSVAVVERLEPIRQVHAVWFESHADGSCVHYSHGQHSYLWPWDLKYYGAAKPPLWLKLVRRGVFISAFQSVDGVNWAPTVNVSFDGLADKLYVGLAACGKPAKFDYVAFGSTPSSLPTQPTAVEARARIDQVNLHWNSGANTVFCDVLRSDTAHGPYTTVGNRITTGQFTDTIQHGNAYYYVISPAGYSGRGPNSKEVSVH